jgi:hypothetical protein
MQKWEKSPLHCKFDSLWQKNKQMEGTVQLTSKQIKKCAFTS